jgi:hypothetical protein
VLLEEHTQEVANAVQAIRRHIAEEPTSRSAYSRTSWRTWSSGTRTIHLYSASRPLLVASRPFWVASSQQLAHGTVTAGSAGSHS